MKKILIAFIALALAVITIPMASAEGPPIKKCTGCHGKTLVGKKKSPSIAGMPARKLLAAMGHGVKPDEVGTQIKPAGKIPKPMTGIAKKLNDAQKTALATLISACPKEGCPE